MIYKTEYKVDIPDIDFDFNNFKNTINQPSGDFFYDPWTLKPKYKGSVWEYFLDSLPEVKGEARVIILEPGTTYMAHADIDNRWHLNLSGFRCFLIDLDSNTMHPHKKDGYWHYMDAGKIHAATNYGNVPRAQLVVRELLKECNLDNLIRVEVKPINIEYDTRYKFDNYLSPWLNKANNDGLIRNFVANKSVVTFEMPIDFLESLKNAAKGYFTIEH